MSYYLINTYYNAIGYESQLETYFRIPFDDYGFLEDLNTCKVSTNLPCIYSSKAWYRSKNLFVPQWDRRRVNYDQKGQRPLRDCHYDVFSDGSYTWDDSTLATLFYVGQHNCSNEIVNNRGGATLSIVAYCNDGIVVSCPYHDLNNGSYRVICLLQRNYTDFYSLGIEDDSKKNSGGTYCLTLSILLEYEHFDGYGELFFDLDNRRYLYPPTRDIIIDNESFCFKYKSQQIRQQHMSLLEVNRSLLRIENEAVVFTGMWRVVSNYTLNVSTILEPSLANALVLYTGSDILYSSLKLARYINSYSLAFSDIHLRKKQDGTAVNQPLSTISSSVFPAIGTLYHFIGASHMRYFFDIISLGFSNYSSDIGDRKHSSLKIGPFQFHESTVAESQAYLLTELCNKSSSQTSRQVIVMQTGSWDLYLSSLRQILHTKHSALKLVGVLSDIISGKCRCNGLAQLIFVTAPPYPSCFHNRGISHCEVYRGGRNSGSIATLNAFYLNTLLKVPIRRDIKVSVVDMFSIIKPRMFFDENFETVCEMHFACRKSSASKITHITPGGLASLKSILSAFANH